jgi:hypothetical protein
MVAHIKKIAGMERNRQFYRKFGNHEYWNSGEANTKAKAQKNAEERRREGFLVRVTKAGIIPGWYTIWVSPRKGE